jgi:hypothetical protein
MQILASTAVTFLTISVAGLAQEKEVTDAISNHVEAFQSQDFEAVFHLASSLVQRSLSSLYRFE